MWLFGFDSVAVVDTQMQHSASAVRRARDGDLVVFAVAGVLLASWMSRVPDVKDALGLGPSQLGMLMLALAVGAVIGLPTAGRIAHRIGGKRTVQLGAIATLSGFVLAAVAVDLHAPMFVVLAGLFLSGLGNGVWDVAQNLEGTIIEQALGRSIMPWFHAAFSGGTVVAALIGAALVWLHVPIAAHLIAVAILSAIAVIWGTRQFLPGADQAERAEQRAEHTGWSPWREPRTLLIGVMVLAAAFTEGTANDWLAVAFVDGHDLPNALGVLALAVFLTFMTAGRIVGTRVLDRFGRVPVLWALFSAAIVGCVLVVFGTPVIAFVGAAVWGVGASLGFPVGMSAAADDPKRAALRLSVVSTVGYTAFLAGPPFLGFLGDHVGILRALLAVGAVSVLAIIVTPAARPIAADA